MPLKIFRSEPTRMSHILYDCNSERSEILRSKGISSIRGTFGKAGLEQEKALRCMRMFAEEVMPNFVDEPVPAAR